MHRSGLTFAWIVIGWYLMLPPAINATAFPGPMGVRQSPDGLSQSHSTRRGPARRNSTSIARSFNRPLAR
jgi:hypothetical protein